MGAYLAVVTGAVAVFALMSRADFLTFLPSVFCFLCPSFFATTSASPGSRPRTSVTHAQSR